MKKHISVSLIFFICFSTLVFSQRGKNSALTISSTGTVVNAYTTLISDASAANMSITVGSNILNNHFASNLAAGDLIFIIQMQGATMQEGVYWPLYGIVYPQDYHNSGKYEFAQVASVSGSNIINLTCGLTYDYSAGGHTQIVRVPRYTTLTINAGGELTCDPWNGSTGGVLVVETLGSVTNNGLVNVTGKGFRGGAVSAVIASSYTQDVFQSTDPNQGGQKGEGIAGQGGVLGTYCKGPPANGGGGGNSHNHGGGGGCNVSSNSAYNGKGIPDLSCPLCAAAWEREATGFSNNVSYGGGRGGYSFSGNNLDASMYGPALAAWGGTERTNHGGLGGWPLYENEGGYKRLFMGGGGGGGHQNDNWGGAGGNGGGIIYFMSYGSVTGSGTFQAHGNPGGNSDGLVQPPIYSQDVTGTDGCGGGGGGGSIVINAVGGISNISAYADGGKGGDQIKRVGFANISNQEAEGPGGGGGGGYVAVSGTPSITKTTNGGVNGTTSVGSGTAAARNSLSEFPPNGATKGGPGINSGVVTNFSISSSDVAACQGQAITLGATINGTIPPGGLSYGWYTAPVGGTLLSSGLNYTVSNPQVQDTFYFRTCPGTYSIPVVMFVSPFLPDAGNNVSICTGNTVGLQATCGGCTSPTYNWLPATGLSNSHASNPTFSGTATTTYSVTITNLGCTAVDYVTVNVNPGNTITLSTDGWTSAQTKCINTDISDIIYATTGATGATITGLPAGVTGSWASNTVTISGTPSEIGTFTYTIILTGGCGTVNTTGTITVWPNGTLTLTAGGTQTTCINAAITTTTYATIVSSGATITGLPSGVTGSWASDVVTISGTPAVTGTFTYTVTLTGGCGSANTTGIITVTPNNTITLSTDGWTSAQTKCINTDISDIIYATTGATGATITGLPVGVTGSWASNTVTISGTPSETGTFTYTIILTGGCGTADTTGTITVWPDGTLTLTAGGTQTTCINTAITTTTYATTVSSGVTISGLPPGVTGSWASDVVTISGTPSVTGTFTYTVTLTGGCGSANTTGTITVTPNNTISLTAGGTQIICINTAITTTTYATTGATGASFSGLPAGVTGNWASDTVTISGTPTVTGTFTYTVTTTGGCGGTTASETITVISDNIITLSSAAGTDAQIQCIDTAILNITYATGGATGAVVSGLPAGVSGNWASNVVTISGTPSVTGTFNYTIDLTGGCGTVTANGTITVTPNNTVTAPTSMPTLCINTALTAITHTTSGASGIGTSAGLPAGVSASWAANIITISGTPTASGTFNYSIPLTGGCGAVNATGTITVVPDNTITLVSGGTQTICINTAVNSTTYSTSGATGAVFSGLPAGVTANWASNTVTISGTPTVSGTFIYTIDLTGGCGTVTANGTITVTPDNTVSVASSTPTLCINTALTAITHTTSGATGIGTATGLPAGVTASWASNTITISGTPTASGTFTYSIPLTGGCGTVNATGTITITPNNTITLVAGGTQTKCVNTAITTTTYATTGATGAAFSGLPAGVTGNWASDTVTISGTPTVTGTFTYTVTTTGGCGGTIASGTITVISNNVVALSSAAGTDAQTQCINTAILNITYATGGATGAVVSGLPAGVSGNWASNVVTISGTPSVTGTFNYTIALTGGCGTVTANGTITVTPNNTVTAPSSMPTLCINTALTAITHTTSGASGIGTSAGLPAGVSASWAANIITISGTPTASGTFNYSIPLTGGCGAVNATGTITVTPNNTITLVSGGTQTKCINTAVNATTYSTTGATGAVFSGLPAGVTGMWASNVVIISGTPTVSGTFTYTVTLTGGCGTVTTSDTITVIPDNIITLSSAAGTDAQTLCINTPITDINYATVGATGAVITGLPSGITGLWAANAVTISGTPSVTGTYTYTITLTGGCGTVTTTGTITVSLDNTVILSSAAGTNAQTKCVNTAITSITYTTTGATGATFSGLPSGVTGNWASNTVTISGTPSVSGAFIYTVTLTGGCGTITTNGTITVTPDNTITLSSAVGTNVQTKCINTAITNITYTTTGATAATFSGLPTGVTGNWTSNTVTISGIPTVSGTYNYTITLTGGCGTIATVGTITVTPEDNPAFHYPLSTYCQSGTDPVAIITGGATGTFTAAPAGLNFLNTSSGLIDLSASAVNNYVVTFTTNGTCPSDTTFAISIVTAPSAAFNYTGPYCQDDTDPAPTLGTGAIAGIFSAVPAGLVFVSTNTGEVNLTASAAGTYTVTNNIAATGGCPAVIATANITINPLPLVSIPGNISVCNNGTVPATSFVSTPAGGTFTWTNSNTAIGLAAGGTGNIAAFTATNPGTNPIIATITVTPTANNCTGHDTTFTITVNPTPTVTVPSNITVCNGASVAATAFSSPTTGVAYSWTNSDVIIGLGANGSGNITAFTATNTGSVPVTATISVTPTANSCAGLVSAYTITVNPSPLVVIPSDTSVCHGATIAGTAFNSPTSGATFTWTNSSTSIGVGASGTGDLTSFTATNTGTVAVVATITVTATANSCAGTPSSYTITVDPLPGIVMNNTLPTCPGLNNGTITPEITCGTAPYQYSWSTGAVTSQLTDLGNGTYVVTVTDFKGCSGTNSIEFSVYDDCLDPVVYVPNIFSPNDDGQNDIFYVRGQDIQYMDLLIYDRWGEKIFESEDNAVGWDGSYKGKEMPSGVYVYKLTVTMNDGSEIKKKGNITLVR